MLDTDTASFIIKGRSPSVADRLATADPSMICISAITRAELMYGLKTLPPEHRIHLGVRRFLQIVSILPWDGEAADYYAEIKHQLLKSRQPIGEMDMMIAAHSMSACAVLVTNNTRHFSRIRLPLTLANWRE
jgi:tRNA(fMet)-specific endonuclease VapC